LSSRCFVTKENATNTIFRIWSFSGFFWHKKQPKLIKQLMKFSEILFSKCLSTKENATKKLFWHFWAFLAKITKIA
tara:strand:- start:198 stop:425 length:228 start_codon:yes stop_codon:yes gene_type:complete